ncbi:hypothetical protein [Rhodanobacter lindaniclasticus]
MENTLTVAELKRRGAAAIEDGLEHGPIHILKRNKTAAVVLSESDYLRLIGARGGKTPGLTAMQWLLAHPRSGRPGKRDIDRGLRKDRDW